jgi:hypothetical protein
MNSLLGGFLLQRSPLIAALPTLIVTDRGMKYVASYAGQQSRTREHVAHVVAGPLVWPRFVCTMHAYGAKMPLQANRL